jgi:heterodisulfide reductase subunit A-like polyferredoxin
MRAVAVSQLLGLLFWGASAAKQCQNSTDIIERDVAIIGGGSAGTYAAVRLRDLGKSVIVIEKDVVLGGHTDTYGEYRQRATMISRCIATKVRCQITADNSFQLTRIPEPISTWVLSIFTTSPS